MRSLQPAAMRTVRAATLGKVTPGIIVSRSVPVLAPTGGWNRRDSLANMRPEEAVTLDNFFPDLGQVTLRGGFTSHATGVGSGDVDTLAEFHAGSTRRLIAAGGGSIYNATSVGAATSLASGFSNNQWQTIQFRALMGLVNGTDDPQTYDGSVIAAMTISGPTINNVIGIAGFKSRSYFFEDNAQSFWYSSVNALGGVLTEFNLTDLGEYGGNLIGIGTWTRDGGDGQDDVICFVMSSGEVIVYQGDNPGDAANWSMIGVFRIGAPLGIRAITKVGGDLVVSTLDGYIPMMRILPFGRSKPSGAVSDKISNEVATVTGPLQANFGWQSVLYPQGKYMLFNVPLSTTTFNQHVMNLVTGAWCRFTGMNGRCWATFNDDLFFGGTAGIVFQADNGLADNGVDISADAETAYSYLRDATKNKHVLGVRPVVSGSGALSMSIIVQADFQRRDLVDGIYSFTSGSPATTVWEALTVNNWEDYTDPWQANEIIVQPWLTADISGMMISTLLKYKGQQEFNWFRTDYLAEFGGVF